MKKVAILGTCQSKAIFNMLRTSEIFNKEFKVEVFLVTHEASEDDIENFFSNLSGIDIIIHQPVSENYRDGIISTFKIMNEIKKVNKNIISILYPYIYWDGYFPSCCYIKDSNNKLIQKFGIHYHHKEIIKEIVRKIKYEKEDDYYFNYISNEDINKMKQNFKIEGINILESALESIKDLQHREKFPYGYGKEIDIKVTDYIIENYQNERLFFSMNHPCNNVLFHVIYKILEILEENYKISSFLIFNEIKKNVKKEELDSFSFPIEKKVEEILNLNFSSEVSLINKKLYEYSELIEKYFNHYLYCIKIKTLVNNYKNWESREKKY